MLKTLPAAATCMGPQELNRAKILSIDDQTPALAWVTGCL